MLASYISFRGWAAMQYYLHMVLPGVSSILCNHNILEMRNILCKAFRCGSSYQAFTIGVTANWGETGPFN
uniref:Uncharacterized protein n=1 Tax=Amphimedon queenslandica TaxID=400682 RepID=A0A1X7TIN7_AMPQE